MRREITDRPFSEMMASRSEGGWHVKKASDPFYPWTVEIGKDKDMVNTTPKGNGDGSEGTEKTQKGLEDAKETEGAGKNPETANPVDATKFPVQNKKMKDATIAEDTDPLKLSDKFTENGKRLGELAGGAEGKTPEQVEHDVNKGMTQLHKENEAKEKRSKVNQELLKKITLSQMIAEKNGTGFFKAGGASLGKPFYSDDIYGTSEEYVAPDNANMGVEGRPRTGANNIGVDEAYHTDYEDPDYAETVREMEIGEGASDDIPTPMPYYNSQWKAITDNITNESSDVSEDDIQVGNLLSGAYNKKLPRPKMVKTVKSLSQMIAEKNTTGFAKKWDDTQDEDSDDMLNDKMDDAPGDDVNETISTLQHDSKGHWSDPKTREAQLALKTADRSKGW